MKTSVSALILFLVTSFVATITLGTTYYVDGRRGDDSWNGLSPGMGGKKGPKKTIQAGIDAASDGDVVIVARGIYTGDGNRDLDFHGKAITVKSRNGAKKCIIDCEGTKLDPHRGFYFHSAEGSDSIVKGFTITNGYAAGDWPENNGGGIYCNNSSPTIAKCTISSNETADYGGGIYFRDSNSPTVTHCRITNNTADSGGGILCWKSNPRIIHCSVVTNNAENSGGGIYAVLSAPTISDCTITGNSSYSGAGICCNTYSYAVIRECHINGNTASNSGGGVTCEYDSHGEIVNCNIVGNVAGEFGGGIRCNEHSSLAVTNCTIFQNSAGYYGGGIGCDYGGNLIVTNSIIWQNTPDGAYVAYGDPVFDYSVIQGGWSGMGVNNIDRDPLLTPTGHLTAGSPCVDWCPTGPEEDIYGDSRPFPVNGAYDIGADEFVDSDDDGLPDWWEAKHYGDAGGDPENDSLTNLDEYNNGTDPDDPDTDGDGRNDGIEITDGTNPLHPDNSEKIFYVNGIIGDDTYDGFAATWDGEHGPKATIQAGIDATVTDWGYTVLVADSTYVGPGNKELDFGGRAIKVKSENGAENCIIDCEYDGRGVRFHTGERSGSVIDGFTIYSGKAESGGGIYCSYSSPTIVNCVITGCEAIEDNSGGGGIYCYQSNPTITGCIITRNSSSERGGGIACWHGSGPIITDCTIADNTAIRDGGGIFCGYYYWRSNAMITSSVISGNSSRNGGGIFCAFSNPTLDGCTITENHASNSGGAIYFEDSNPTIMNSQINDNTAYGNGGGISCRFNSCPIITNCTIAYNVGGFPTINVGGGIYCSENSCPEINDCTISNNWGWKGGGIFCKESSPVITNCIFRLNIAGELGGAIHCRGESNPVIINCTITDNSARDQGGAISCAGESNPMITNCILWDNHPDEIHTKGSCSATVSYCDIKNGWSGAGENNVDVLPLLTPDGHLKIGSPCIDLCPIGPGHDMDGEIRPFPFEGYHDIGADEYVDSDADGMPDWWELRHFGSVKDAYPGADGDMDGLTNLFEYENGSDPVSTDTDGDVRDDAQEFAEETNPLHPDNSEKIYYVNAETGDDN